MSLKRVVFQWGTAGIIEMVIHGGEVWAGVQVRGGHSVWCGSEMGSTGVVLLYVHTAF